VKLERRRQTLTCHAWRTMRYHQAT